MSLARALDAFAARAVAADRASRQSHDLFKTGDLDAPEQIKDHGEVVLQACRRCGRVEIELDEPCRSLDTPERAKPDTSDLERAKEIIPPRFVTDLIELKPMFSTRVAFEEKLRADIAVALAEARRAGESAGWDAAFEAFAAYCDEHPHDNGLTIGEIVGDLKSMYCALPDNA